METELDSVRRIISRWAITNTPLTADTMPGDTNLAVINTARFQPGDEIMIRNSVQGETPLYVVAVVDNNNLTVTPAVKYHWKISDSSILHKTFNQMFVQGIYLGDPDNIPMFPAITVNATSRESEWLTIKSTKETYRLKATIYVEAAAQEAGYRFLLQMVNTLQHGLKQNIYPLVAPYQVTLPLTNLFAGDEYIKVTDSSLFQVADKNRLLIEDRYKTEEFSVAQIIDSQTIKVFPKVFNNYALTDGLKLIIADRFLYNAWPDSIEYGTIFKGTMLKAAAISWFAWEEQLQKQKPMDVSLS